MASVVAIGTDK